MGPAARLRIDANAAWSREEALAALPVLDAAAGGLEYAEQPCAELEDLAAVRRALDIPIAADESVRRAEDPLRVARAEAADLLVRKVQPRGGVQRCLELAEQAGLPVGGSSALESSGGRGAGLAPAPALPDRRPAGAAARLRPRHRDPPHRRPRRTAPARRRRDAARRAERAVPGAARAARRRCRDRRPLGAAARRLHRTALRRGHPRPAAAAPALR